MFWNKKLSPETLEEFNQLNTLVSYEKYKLWTISRNTAQIKSGRALLKQQNDLVLVLDQQLKDWIGQTLTKVGCIKGINYNINGKTGVITEMGSTNEKPLTPEELKSIGELK